MVLDPLFCDQSMRTLPGRGRLRHPRDDQPGQVALQPLRVVLRQRARLLGGQAADPRVELQPLAARGLRQRVAGRRPRAPAGAPPPPGSSRRSWPGAPGSRSKTSRSGSQPCSGAGRTGVSAVPGPIGAGEAPHRDVQLERGQVGRPDQRGQVVDHQVLDRLARRPRAGSCCDTISPVRTQSGRRRGRVLGEERLVVHAVRVALERHRAPRDVRQQHRRRSAGSSRAPRPW